MQLRLLELLAIDLIRGGKSDAGRHPRTRRRQGRLPNSMSGSFLRPPPAGRNWDVVAVAQFTESSSGEAEVLREVIERRRPGSVVELLAGEGDGGHFERLHRRIAGMQADG